MLRIVIASMLGVILSYSLFAISPALAEDWYVGKGLKQGDYFRYSVCNSSWKHCSPVEIDFWVKNQTNNGSGWNLKFLAVDGAIVQRGNVTIGTSISYTTHFDPNVANYAGIYNDTIAWLASFTTKDSPKHFSDSIWGREDAGYCSPSIGPLGHETVTVQAGTFDTWKIGFYGAADSMIWIDPNLPFPIKGSFYVPCLGVAGAIPWFNFELLQTGNSQTPPQFVVTGPKAYAAPAHTPLKQFRTGSSINQIECNREFTLLAKTSDNSPACVRPETAQKLVERGWGTIIKHFI